MYKEVHLEQTTKCHNKKATMAEIQVITQEITHTAINAAKAVVKAMIEAKGPVQEMNVEMQELLWHTDFTKATNL